MICSTCFLHEISYLPSCRGFNDVKGTSSRSTSKEISRTWLHFRRLSNSVAVSMEIGEFDIAQLCHHSPMKARLFTDRTRARFASYNESAPPEIGGGKKLAQTVDRKDSPAACIDFEATLGIQWALVGH